MDLLYLWDYKCPVFISSKWDLPLLSLGLLFHSLLLLLSALTSECLCWASFEKHRWVSRLISYVVLCISPTGSCSKRRLRQCETGWKWGSAEWGELQVSAFTLGFEQQASVKLKMPNCFFFFSFLHFAIEIISWPFQDAVMSVSIDIILHCLKYKQAFVLVISNRWSEVNENLIAKYFMNFIMVESLPSIAVST